MSAKVVFSCHVFFGPVPPTALARSYFFCSGPKGKAVHSSELYLLDYVPEGSNSNECTVIPLALSSFHVALVVYKSPWQDATLHAILF
eukprot:1140266-Pelagomonas_calceolata.AAC.9